MQDAAGNIFVDRSGIRKHSDHSVINILVGIFVIFQVVFRPAAYCGCLMICLYQTISTLTCVRSISIAKLSINSIQFRIDIPDPSQILTISVIFFLRLYSRAPSVWAFEKVTDNKKRKKNRQEEKDTNYRSQVIIPYVEGVSERVDWVLKKYSVATALHPHITLDTCWCTQRTK